jgi:two-component system, NtrC family, sensor kinase
MPTRAGGQRVPVGPMIKVHPQLVAVLDALEDGIIIIQPDLVVEFMNQAMVRLFGPGQGRKCHRVIYRRGQVCPWCKAEEVFKHQETLLQERYLPFLDRIFNISELPLDGENGHISKLSIYRDITRAKKHEEKLKASQQDYRSLFEHVACGVFISSKEGKFLNANQALVSMLGYDNKDDFLKVDIAKDLYLNSGDRQRFQELIEQDGHVVNHEVYFKHKSGRPIPVLQTGHVRYDKKGNVVGYEGLNVDQSQRKQMEKELGKTRLQLVQAEKMASLGKLAAGVAHQLNNPLGGITLFGQLILEEYDLPDGCRQDVERILGDARRCSDIVKQLLQFSRQTQNKIQTHDINQALTRTLFLLENQTLFQNIEVKKKLDKNLPHIPVDILNLNQVFMNIILNAAQAMSGKGTLSLETNLNTEKKAVHIQIADTGPGITERILPLIFEPFFTTKEEGQGTGLGLSLAYGIVEDHDGRLTARSKLGEGTIFEIELPIGASDNDQ